MLRLLSVGALISAVLVGGLSVASANAAGWHTNGPLTTVSTDGGAMRFVIHPHAGTPGSFTIACTASFMHLVLNAATSTALPWTNAATVTPRFTNCLSTGGAGVQIVCAPAEFRAASYSGGTTFATAGGGITSGAVTNVDCRLSIGATDCVTITGTAPAHYTNAGVPGGSVTGNGRLTITPTGQILTADDITPCAVIPSGTVTWGSPGAGITTINDLAYTFDGPNAPYLYRTP